MIFYNFKFNIYYVLHCVLLEFIRKFFIVFILLSLFTLQKSFAQWFEIESILVDACSPNNPVNEEGYNEMVRFKVGPAPLNTGTLNVTWPNGANPWLGLIQDATTASKVASLNADISTAGSCGQILEPTGGVLPANATVILVTSQNVNVAFNSFASLTGTIYMIFQNNPSTIGGNFANWNVVPGLRTLVMSFGGACNETVTYERSLLINSNGTYGGTNAVNDGSTVNFTPAGVASYVNNGCNAPIPPFTVNAGNSITACKGSTVNLLGTAQGQQSVLWTAPSGTFSTANNLATNYTIDPNVVGNSIVLTLTATNICNLTRTSTVTINLTTTNPPNVTTPVNYCQNAVATPLSATASVGGILNWYGTNATGGVASVMAPTPSTATLGTTTYYVSQTIAGCESVRVPIVVTVANTGPSLNLFCDYASVNTILPTQLNFDFSNVGQTNFSYSYTVNGGPAITGVWVAPSNYTVFGLSAGDCVAFTLVANGVGCVSPQTAYGATSPIVPNFAAITPFCSGNTAPALATTSPNGIMGTWSPTTINNTTSGSYVFTPNAALNPCASTQTLNVTILSSNTIILASAANTNNQSLCFGTPITPIKYNTTGATGATFSGLPAGVNGNFAANQVTISGTPSTAVGSPFNYTVTLTGGCGTVTANGTITVTANNTITLTSGVTSTNQTVCSGSVITSVTYNTTGATGATFSGLPAGVNGNFAANQVTISGTPSTAVGSPFNYTVTLTGGCGNIITNGTITVTSNNTITLTSGATSTNQTVCSGSVITSVTYNTTGATGATFSGLPAGVNGNFVANQVTISGTPSTAVGSPFNYTITLIGGCGTVTANGTITVTANNTIILTSGAPSTNQTVCSSSVITSVTYNTTGATGATFSGLPAGVNGNFASNQVTISGTPSTAVGSPFNYTITLTGGCGTVTANGTITITPNNTITLTSSAASTNQTVCSGSVITSVTYNTTGATGATFSGLPAGVNGNFAANQVTISGTPSTAVGSPFNYTVTLSGGCGTISANGTITVTNKTNPTFNQVPPACSGSTINPLPTNSLNGISGSWSPAINNTMTTIYTFTPNNGQCANTTTMTITIITTPTAPTFNFNTTYCSGTTINPFPTTSNNGITGIWSPTLNNTTSTNYTFTPNLGQCASSVIIPITIVTAPTITQPSDYIVCDDNNDGVSCLFNLGTKDSEISVQSGIQITYHLTLTDSQTNSNAISKTVPYCNVSNPQTIFVRVFNPLAPTCSSYTSFKLIVNPKPVANLPQDYHLCAPIFGATSAVYNLTSVVTPQVLGSTLPPSNYSVTYYESLLDAQGPTAAITPASAYSSGTRTLWIRIANNATSCFDIITVKLVLDPLPVVLPFYAQYELCETVAPLGQEFFDLASKVNYILQAQMGMQVTFYPTLAQAQAGTGAINTATPYQNVQLYAQTIGIRVTNIITGCYSISTMDLVVNPKPQPIPQTQPYTVCDTNTDGKACFDLNTLTPNITFQTAGVYTITYHPTKADAESNSNVISTATPYCNTTPFIEYLWIRAQNPTTGCYNTMRIELNVNPAPVAPVNLASIAKCDQDANPQDGCTSFDLTQQNSAILAQEPLPGSSYSITYYDNLMAASSTTPGLAIVPANNYTSCMPNKTIWVRVQNTTTGCYSVGSFDIQVNTPIVLTTPTLYSVCDNDAQPNNLYTTFNLTTFIGVIPNHSVAFYLDANHTQLIINPSAFVNTIAATQTLFLVATNTTTGCKSYRTLTVEVLPIPEPNTDLSAPQYLLEACDDNYTTTPNDGYEVFDLTTNAAYIMNNDPNLTLHYFASYADANGNVNEIKTGSPQGVPTAASVNGNVWIRVESNNYIDTNNMNCYVLVEQPVRVNPIPLITPGIVYQECDNDTDGFTQFNLNSQAAALLSSNPLPLSNYSLTFYQTPPPSTAIATPNSYTNTNTTGNTQTIYVVATNTTTGCKSPVGQFTIMVNPKPILIKPADYAHCDDEVGDNDGYYQYPLDVLIPSILGATQAQTDYTVSFYNTQYNPPLLNPTPIAATSLGSYQAYTHTLWVSVRNNSTGCERIDSFTILIEQPPTPVITADSNVICVDFNTHQVVRDLVLTAENQTQYLAGTSVPSYTYQWFDQTGAALPGATASTYTVASTVPDDISTTYTVAMTSTSLGCAAISPDFEVLQSGQAVAIPAGTSGYTVTNAFSQNQTITVNVDGYGSYQYSLDDGPRQISNVFENVSLGEHNITVWDTKGGIGSSCDPIVLSGVLSVDYPHYFTPNGDGINDYWNIVGLQNQPMAKIYIYDRYGKLIKEISPQSQGWDGTYNGNLMISTDYWFKVFYNELNTVKEFKSHFSLKR